MQYGEPIAGATPQRVAKVLLNANIGHKDLVAVDVDVASTAARSVGHGAGVATEDAGDGAGVRGLFFVKSGELRQLEAEGGRGARGRISERRPSSAHSGACQQLGQSAAPAAGACKQSAAPAAVAPHASEGAPRGIFAGANSREPCLPS